MPTFDLVGRTALVTGGSAGIGLALTRLLIREGVSRIIIVGRDADRLATVAAEFPGAVTTYAADLSCSVDVDRLIAELPMLAPDLSLLINNAGSQLLTDLPTSDGPDLIPDLRMEIAVNFTGVIALCIGLLPQLSRQPSAAIVNVTSGLALAPKMSSPVYCATKAGVRTFTRALRYQCEAELPHVQVIEALPPIVDTSMTKGRGRAKITPEACAAEIIAGVQAGQREVYVGKAKLLRAIMRVSPELGYRIMRGG
jgi:uncharacterized oxidoreductase